MKVSCQGRGDWKWNLPKYLIEDDRKIILYPLDET